MRRNDRADRAALAVLARFPGLRASLVRRPNSLIDSTQVPLLIALLLGAVHRQGNISSILHASARLAAAMKSCRVLPPDLTARLTRVQA